MVLAWLSEEHWWLFWRTTNKQTGASLSQRCSVLTCMGLNALRKENSVVMSAVCGVRRLEQNLKRIYSQLRTVIRNGGMAEWFKAAVLKTASRKSGRGFESYSLRHPAPRLWMASHVPVIRDAKRLALNGTERCPSWPKGHDWKSCVPTKIGTEGSNPSLSANLRRGFGWRAILQ